MDQLGNTKTNFLHFSNEFEREHSTWNFAPAGHGKSPPDGIGGSIKESCNRALVRGDNVLGAKDMKRIVISTSAKTKVFVISEDDAN